MATEYGPSPAERARTVLACAAVPTIDIAGRVAEDVAVHATNAEGALVLLAPTAGVLGERAACGPAVATLHATRLLPLPVPDRVLARVTIHGTLELVGNPAAAVELLGRSAAPDQTAGSTAALLGRHRSHGTSFPPGPGLTRGSPGRVTPAHPAGREADAISSAPERNST